jgi:hypothetical protein
MTAFGHVPQSSLHVTQVSLSVEHISSPQNNGITSSLLEEDPPPPDDLGLSSGISSCGGGVTGTSAMHAPFVHPFLQV